MQERNVTADGCWCEDLEKTAQIVYTTGRAHLQNIRHVII